MSFCSVVEPHHFDAETVIGQEKDAVSALFKNFTF
jgi:hypothetical protein